jgi:predicted FMN-binding regulatory protein PaiB
MPFFGKIKSSGLEKSSTYVKKMHGTLAAHLGYLNDPATSFVEQVEKCLVLFQAR